MNLLYPYSWIKEYLQTDLEYSKFANIISLCGSSIEHILKQEDGDYVFDTEITTNRSDLIGIYGFARDAYAILSNNKYKCSLLKPEISKPVLPASFTHTLNIKTNPVLNPRYSAVVLKDVKIGDSPKYIKDRISKCGVRPLNNIVDITNYIMLEFGQPMHAFDFDKIEKGEMFLRATKTGETIKTLDGIVRKLPEGSIIIEDSKKIYDLCGIMGGENSAIDKNTKTVILFTQIYKGDNIRKTSLILNHRTQAGQIFEKGIDPKFVLESLYKGIDLAIKYANAKIASKIYDIDTTNYKEKKVILTKQKLDTYLGEKSNPKEVLSILNSLQIETTFNEKNSIFTSTIPSQRHLDIAIEEDLIEEIARIKGYHNLQGELLGQKPPQELIDLKFFREFNLKNFLKFQGFNEVYTYSLVEGPQTESIKSLTLKNPLTQDMKFLRNLSLIPSLEKVITQNKGRFETIKLFEIANIYRFNEKGEPNEIPLLTFITNKKEDYFYLKGVAENLLKDSIGKVTFVKGVGDSKKLYIDNQWVEIIVDRKSIGTMGVTSQGNFACELLADYLTTVDKIKMFEIPSSFVAIKEDISFIVPAKLCFSEISDALNKISLEAPNNVALFFKDTFQNSELRAKSQKSYTFEALYTNTEKQLTDNDVSPLRKTVCERIEKSLRATIRKA